MRTRRAKAITIINLKGGVGKTHTTWLLTGVAQERGLKCLAVDLDQQGNLTRSLTERPTDGPGTQDLFRMGAEVDVATVIHKSKLSNIDTVRSSASLQPLDLTDQRRWERSDLHLALVDLVQAVRQSYDYIFFDCPTKLSLTGFAALTASDFVIVPLEPADWGAQGVVQVTEAINYVRSRHNPRLRLLGYLISRLKTRRKYHRIYCEELQTRFGQDVFDTVIRDLAGYEQAVSHGIPVNLRRPASTEAQIARQFFAEVEERTAKRSSISSHSRGPSVRTDQLVAAQR